MCTVLCMMGKLSKSYIHNCYSTRLTVNSWEITLLVLNTYTEQIYKNIETTKPSFSLSLVK